MRTKSIANGNLLMLLFSIWFMAHSLVMSFLQTDLMVRGVITGFGAWFIPFILYLVITRQKLKDVLNLTIPSVKKILFAILLGAALVPAIITLTVLIPILSSYIFPPQDTTVSWILDSVPSFWMLMLWGAVLPAILEELWFRGVFFDQYRNGAKKASILMTGVITGLVFGLIHSDLAQIIYAIPYGILFAYLVYYSRSIWIPVITHFVANALAFTLGYIQPTPEMTEYVVEMAEVSPWEGIIIFGVIALLMMPVIFLCMKKFKKYHKDTLTTEEVAAETNAKFAEKPKIFTWPLWLTIVLLVTIALLRSFGIIA